jgi:hypothetical protein
VLWHLLIARHGKIVLDAYYAPRAIAAFQSER